MEYNFNKINGSSTYDLVEILMQMSADVKHLKEQLFSYLEESKKKKNWQHADTTMQEQQPEQLYNEKETAKFLAISPRKLQQLRVGNEIKYTKIGKLIKYSYRQIQDFIDKRKVHDDAT